MSAATPRDFGPYEILAPIGEGGMGQVFKARDTRLGRLVAIKIARDRFTDRFAGEARATAALNHPHIATLYDVGPDYLVMEYVEGETLRGPIPLARALLLARQILEALEAAHARGIVHRDLKPDNILIAKSGVKLLDFGLAQMKEAQPLGDATATMVVPADSAISGTLHYMSPEQLQGQPADARSDIFAFGVVLYEMLTGRRAFDGANAASVISAIMTADAPSLPNVQLVAPPLLDRVLRQCLAKDPDERWQTAGDVRRALELAEASPAVQSSTPSARPFRWWWAAAAFALGGVIAGATFWAMRPKPPEPFSFRPLTFSGRAYRPSLSPDGKQIAFFWSGEKDRDIRLYLQLASGGNPLPLPDAHPFGRTAWSPDGNRLAFAQRDGLYTMSALGGSPRRISAVPEGVDSSNVAWSGDGVFLIADGLRAGLSTVAAEGGEARELTKPAAGEDAFPSIAPDHRSVAFVRRTSTYNSALMILPLNATGAAAGDARQITTGVWDIAMLDWTPDGRELVFEGSSGSNNPALWRVPLAGGKPVRIVTPGMISGEISIARASGRMVYVSGLYETKVFRMPLGAAGTGEPEPVVEGLGDHRDLSVAPDGLRIAFTSNRTGSKEIWIANADGSSQTQLTSFGGPAVGSPRWSPDGKRIAFDAYASGSSDIYVVPVEGGKPERITSDSGNEVRPSWSRDGRSIYFGWTRAAGRGEIWKIPLSGGNPVQVTRNGGNAAFETPDGRWLIVSRPPDLLRMRVDGTEESAIGHDAYTNFVTIGGSHVYVLNGRNLLRAPFDGTGFQTVHAFDANTVPTGGGTCIGVPADERYVLYRRNTRTITTLMLIENFR